ncbi:MAG: hypothetical protein HY606_09915 [Planctomycetes bacterium]|nr:hypothetical protein [Planctomycetota bacterium]
MNKLLLMILLDIIKTTSGDEIECRIVNVTANGVEYKQGGKSSETVTSDKIDLITIPGIPSQFSTAIQYLNENKLKFALDATDGILKNKQLADPQNLIKSQTAHLYITCKIRQAKLVKTPAERKETYLENQKEQSEFSDFIVKSLEEFKASPALFKMLITILDYYDGIKDIPKYQELIQKYESAFQPQIYDNIYFNLIEYFKNKNETKTVLDLLNKRAFGDTFKAELMKISIYLIDAQKNPQMLSNAELSVSKLDKSTEENSVIAESLTGKIEFMKGGVKNCVKRLSKLVARINPSKYKNNQYVTSAMITLADAYEKLGKDAAEDIAKVKYYQMTISTINELLTYYPNLTEKANLRLRNTKLEEEVEKLEEKISK